MGTRVSSTISCQSVSPAVFQPEGPLPSVPPEIITNILMELNLRALQSFRLTCRQLNQISEEDFIWKSLYKCDFPSPSDSKEINNFQEAYKSEYVFLSNFTKGVYLAIDDYYAANITALIAANGMIISGHSDGKICIRALQKNLTRFSYRGSNYRTTLEGHSGAVTSLAIDQRGNLLSSSLDGTIKLWELQKGKFVKNKAEYNQFEAQVKSLIVNNDQVISAVYTADEDIVKIEGSKTTLIISGSFETKCLAQSHGKLIIGETDGDIQVLDVNEEVVAKMQSPDSIHPIFLKKHTKAITSLVVANGILISGSRDATVNFWNLKTGACIDTIFRNKIFSSQLVGGNLVLVSRDGQISIFDSPSRKITASIEDLTLGSTLGGLSNQEENYLVAFSDGKLIIACKNRIKILDFKAEDHEIFDQIGLELRWVGSDCAAKRRFLLERFSRMPKTARNKMYQIIERHSFHDRNNKKKYSTTEAKADAISDSLLIESVKEMHALLTDLGIVSALDYSMHLSCRPAYLKKIGISSAEDLHFICKYSSDLQPLQMENYPLCEHKKILSDLFMLASTVLNDRIIAEARDLNLADSYFSSAICDYYSSHRCKYFKEKLAAFQMKLDSVTESPLLTFSLELARELNKILKDLQAFDRDYQITKLTKYIQQPHISLVWANLQARGIASIKDLPDHERTLPMLLQMGN